MQRVRLGGGDDDEGRPSVRWAGRAAKLELESFKKQLRASNSRHTRFSPAYDYRVHAAQPLAIICLLPSSRSRDSSLLLPSLFAAGIRGRARRYQSELNYFVTLEGDNLFSQSVFLLINNILD